MGSWRCSPTDATYTMPAIARVLRRPAGDPRVHHAYRPARPVAVRSHACQRTARIRYRPVGRAAPRVCSLSRLGRARPPRRRGRGGGVLRRPGRLRRLRSPARGAMSLGRPAGCPTMTEHRARHPGAASSGGRPPCTPATWTPCSPTTPTTSSCSTSRRPRRASAASTPTARPGRRSSSGRRRAPSFEIVALDVTAGDDVAYAQALLRCGTARPAIGDQRLRLTVGLRQEGDRWVVAHEHHSFPDESRHAERRRARRCVTSTGSGSPTPPPRTSTA